MFDLLVMYIIMAGVFTFGKQAVLNSSPFFLTAVRLLPQAVLFLGIVYIFDRKKWYIASRLVPALAGLAFFFFLMDSFRFVALQYVPSAHGALINSLSPFIAALFANLVFKKKFSLKKLIALCIGFFGVLPIIVQNVLSSQVTETSSFYLAGGYAALLVSTISAVVGSFFLKQLVDKEHFSILMALGIAQGIGGLVSLVISLLFEPWNPVPVTHLETVAPIILFLFVSHNLIAQPLYGYLVKKYPVTLVAFATLISPLVSCALGYFLYSQPIDYVFIFSLVTLMSSFYLFYHEEKKEGLV